ncbi:hypothetical protein CO074_00450 [bacterium (Candidatus Moisslbacteria) CG_4_9_14_0_8_um_filter_36_20]|nr:MAG: hypothetical protein CO074_00450 [bacterium (Candidatus Moisslbacteria) CG_4_9_14_0_8_um_filter_36_20]
MENNFMGKKRKIALIIFFIFIIFILNFKKVFALNIKDGTIAKIEGKETLYLISGKTKKIFPHLSVYLSWGYPQDFSTVDLVEESALANYTNDGFVPFKNGSLVREESNPIVFYVENAKLRPVRKDWAYQSIFEDPEWQKIIFFPDGFLNQFNYQVGEMISSLADLKPEKIDFYPELRIFNSEGKLENAFLVFDKNYKGGINLGTADLDADTKEEILIGAGFGSQPEIKIFRSDGTLISQFLAFEKSFKGGVNLAAGDLYGDGQKEIIAGAGIYGSPHLRIFTKNGELITHFFADDKNLRHGLKVAALDFDQDLKEEIVCGIEKEKGFYIKIFSLSSTKKPLKEFLAFEKLGGGEFSLGTGDINADGIKEIVIGSGSDAEPEIRIFDKNGNLLNKFLAYEKNFKGGVKVALADLDKDGKEEIITTAGFSGGPHLKIFDESGQQKNSFFVYDENYKGGVNVAVLNMETEKKIIVVPRLTLIKGVGFYKGVEIDTKKQKLYAYQNGFLIEEEKASTGRPAMPTPLGDFKVLRKSLVEYSKKYNLYMPHWMQFTSSGAGIHGLPYWQDTWGRVYEGVGHLGLPVSHGCVRVSLRAAERIYQWLNVGDRVLVHQ